jgi:hypothetical protein
MNTFHKYASILLLTSILSFIVMPFTVEARSGFGGRGGRSFGSRSFGGARSFGSSKRNSFGSNRTFSNGRGFRSAANGRFANGQQYRMRYGIPRKSSTMNINQNGANRNYTMHSYGGLGDGFMTGYLLGSIPWYWHMPFHPAFYYSKPVVVDGTNGTKEVYPGTFSFGSVIMALLLIGGIGFIIYALFFKKRRQYHQYGEYSSFG